MPAEKMTIALLEAHYGVEQDQDREEANSEASDPATCNLTPTSVTLSETRNKLRRSQSTQLQRRALEVK
jgi:hypothetical protein